MYYNILYITYMPQNSPFYPLINFHCHYFKCTVQWHYVHNVMCTSPSISKSFSLPQTETLYILNNSSFSFSSCSSKTFIYFLSLLVDRISCGFQGLFLVSVGSQTVGSIDLLGGNDGWWWFELRRSQWDGEWSQWDGEWSDSRSGSWTQRGPHKNKCRVWLYLFARAAITKYHRPSGLYNRN